MYGKGFNWFDSLKDNLIDKNNKEWSIKTIYRTKPYLLQYIIEDKQDLIEKCNIIWERYTPKIYNYTMDEIKKLLGIDERDILVVK